MAAFTNPFGSSNTEKTQVSSSGGFTNPFAGYNPPAQAQIPSNLNVGQKVPPTALSQVQNFFQQAGQIATQTGKQILDFLPQAPSYAAAAATHPLQTAGGIGANILEFGGSLGGLIEQGVSKATGLQIPERWDLTKQTEAFRQMKDESLKSQGVDNQKAFATGEFIGQVLPYALGGEASTLTLGEKILVPSAARFLPGATKFIPVINNAIGFLGVGQITHDPNNGTRVDQFKNDLVNLALFEVGGFATRGLTGKTRGLITDAVDAVKDKKSIDFEQVSPQVQAAKVAIQNDLGKPLEVVSAQTIASGKVDNFSTHQIETPERVALREKITNELYGQGAAKKEKRIDIVTGAPAAGKSTVFVDPLAKEHGAIVIDADMAKAKLPEFDNGKNANGVHQESSDIAEGPLIARAIANGDNIVLPVVGKNLNKMRSLVKGLNEAGYEVHLHHNTVPPEVAAARAEARFKKTGRYISPDYILNEVGLKPDQNFDIIKLEKGVKSYEKYSNDVPEGQAPKLLERSRRSENGQFIENAPSAQPEEQISNKAKSKLSSDIEKRLATDFKDIPGYEKMNMKDQAAKATDLLSSDPELAKAVAMGEKNAPGDLKNGSVFTAVREKAFQEGDVQTLHDLAKTNLAGEAGQALKSFDTFRPGDPVKAIHDIIQARTKAIESRSGKTLNEAVKQEVKKMDLEIKKTVTKPKLAEFIRNIQC